MDFPWQQAVLEKGKAGREMLFFLRKASPTEPERAALLRFSQLDVAATSVFFFLLGPAAEAAFQTPRAHLDTLQDRLLAPCESCIPGVVSKKTLEL